jgi:hypothetical protein
MPLTTELVIEHIKTTELVIEHIKTTELVIEHIKRTVCNLHNYPTISVNNIIDTKEIQ